MAISTVVYLFITLLFVIWFVYDFCVEYNYYIIDKDKYELSQVSFLIFIIFIFFNAIWGGIFWW